jgi:hypothetical protein
MEIVKPDKISMPFAGGLLSCPKDIKDINQQGWRKLNHTCGERCLIRIGPGNGPQTFRCLKQHAVKDTPDPTCHQFMKLSCNISDPSKNILTHAGILIPQSYKGARDEHYTIPYFQPTRHMASTLNSTCLKLSPFTS